MVIKRWPGRPPRARHTTPMISLDRLVCRAYGAQALKRRSVKIHRLQPVCLQHQRPRCSLRIIGMLWTGRSCRRRQCWLWRKRKRAAGPTSAPKLRQNRFEYGPTPVLVHALYADQTRCSPTFSIRFGIGSIRAYWQILRFGHDVAAHHRCTFVSRAYSRRGVYLHIAMADDR